ncbi:hypothetical protein ACUXST_001078 [Sphingomonas sp. F9_3S_D5_B_2]
MRNPGESRGGTLVVGDEVWGYPLPSYRLYRLDGAGKIVSAEWVEASSDAEAEQHARDRGLPVTCEMWERNRLVATIEPHRG